MPNSIVKTLTVNGVTYDLKDVDSESYAPKASPALTGTPTAPTASSGTNTTQIATTQFVQSAVSSALSSVMTYKGTKATVSALPSSGNSIGDVWHVTADGGEYAWDGSAWQELGTAIDTSGFVTDVQNSGGTSLVSNGIATIPDGFNISVVQSLPTSNIDTHTIYVLQKAAVVGSSQVGTAQVGGENDVYEEYIYVNNSWEKLGDDIDTEVFARTEDIPTKVSDLTDDVGIVTTDDIVQEVFLINISYSNNTYTADKTSAEAMAALTSGKLVYGYDTDSDIPYIFGRNGSGSYGFQTIGYISEINEYIQGILYYDGTTDYSLSFDGMDLNLLSALGDTNIGTPSTGQVLTYQSNKWINANIPAQNATISMSNNVITLTNASGTTSTIALPVYNGSVSTVGGGS